MASDSGRQSLADRNGRHPSTTTAIGQIRCPFGPVRNVLKGALPDYRRVPEAPGPASPSGAMDGHAGGVRWSTSWIGRPAPHIAEASEFVLFPSSHPELCSRHPPSLPGCVPLILSVPRGYRDTELFRSRPMLQPEPPLLGSFVRTALRCEDARPDGATCRRVGQVARTIRRNPAILRPCSCSS